MKTRVVLATAASALMLMGCSSKEEAKPAATTTTAANTVKKAVVVTKGDEICTADDAKIGEPAGNTEADYKAYLTLFITTGRSTVTQIKALGTPDTDADKLTDALNKYSAFLDYSEKNLDKFAKDPQGMLTDPTALADKEAAASAAKAFGFTKCGQD